MKRNESTAQPRACGDLPSSEQLERLYSKAKYRRRFFSSLQGTVGVLLTVSAAAVLVAVLLLPVLQIYGSSMTPTLEEGSYVVSVKAAELQPGDICAFYFNNKILVKRVIATSGDWVNIDQDGHVSVNGVPLEEPYVSELAFGECDLELPYQVPESRLFVMGDHRNVSVDSRSSVIGCVAEEQIVGKLVFRIWPLSELGPIQ